MTHKHIVFFLEERSAKALLDTLLPRLLPPDAFSFHCIPFEGKSDLQKWVPRKLRAWQKQDTFVVLHDQDGGNCTTLKTSLTDLCAKAGKPDTLVRIACRELESWYLADLRAVEKGLEVKGLARHQDASKYRDPDSQQRHPAKTLQQLTSNKYKKVAREPAT
ncbi:MAG: DUF4276 family protein, partial [Nitrospira sp.]|nr:DUF4276 family protein [Nitrospira sp.]